MLALEKIFFHICFQFFLYMFLVFSTITLSVTTKSAVKFVFRFATIKMHFILQKRHSENHKRL